MPRVTLGIPLDDPSPIDDTPSYEDLTEIVAALQLLSEQREERIGELEELNRSLVERIANLEMRLGRTPRNSSMPPVGAEKAVQPLWGWALTSSA